jgi:hypothetical protein
MLPSLPRTSRADTDANLFADAYANDSHLADILNGNVENDNIKSTAQVAHSKLANATAGQILLANASGIITGTALSGDVTIDSSGVATIANDAVGDAQLDSAISETTASLVTITTDTQVATVTPVAGTYLIVANCVAVNAAATAQQVSFTLRVAGSAVSQISRVHIPASIAENAGTAIAHVTALNGSQAVSVTASRQDAHTTQASVDINVFGVKT